MSRKKKILLFIIGIVIIAFIIFLIFNKNSNSDENKIIETSQKTAEVSEQTIITTLTAPGEVKSATTENLTLNTNYYFLTMCVEKEEFVKKGSNLLKYTNGTYITAPYDCVILDYSVPTTKEICTESNYINIASVEELYMDINIGEEEIEKISVGQEVEIVVNYDETKTYKGTISKINAIGNYSAGRTTFAAIASLENDNSLKIGMSANCTVIIEKDENIPCLPIEAIEIENNEKFVNMIKDDGQQEKVKIETGKADADYVEIVSGISLGDAVYYETTTVTTNSSSNSDTSENIFTSLFNRNDNGKNKGFDRGGF